MSRKKAFIGYDLGDGETITDFVVIDMDAPAIPSFKDMEMPDSNSPGQAIPTAFGYDENQRVVFASSILEDPEEITQIRNNFKRCPSDLMGHISDERRCKIIPLFEAGWPDEAECPEVYRIEMKIFRESVISFTNAIFEHPKYSESVRSEITDCEEVVFCIGHPTKWDDLDVAIYKAILSETVLGKGVYVRKPSEIIMEKESRAAYLYVRDKTKESVLPQGTLALLIDVGSSTIDLTALTSDSRNYQYNSGSKNLGARSIDFLIREWYLEKLKEDEMDWATYLDLIRSNPTMDHALSLCCRKAKEQIYSTSAKKAKIVFADFAPIRITEDIVNELVTTKPIGDVLRKWADLSQESAEAMGDRSWTQLFRDFLSERKAELDVEGHVIGRIILTGSASKMPFVSQIVREIFPKVSSENILNDMNPSRSISMGLAMVGPSNEKSKGFQEDVRILIDEEVPACVESVLPELADSLSVVIESIIINDIIKKKLNMWRNCEYKTLDDMTAAIEKDCSEKNLNTLLQNNQDYNDAIHHWTVDIVGKEIAMRLHEVCKKYNVSEFSVDDLNVLRVSGVSVSGITGLTPMDGLMKAIVAVISVIAGVITAVVLPTVLGIVIGLISLISIDLAVVLLDVLLMMPGIGWGILLGIAGIAVFKAAQSGLGGARRELTLKLQKANIPQAGRALLSDDKINKKLAEEDLRGKIRDSILKEDSKEKIVASVSEYLKTQIQERSDEIKYVIESK